MELDDHRPWAAVLQAREAAASVLDRIERNGHPVPGEPPPTVCGRPIPSPKGRNVAFDVFGTSISDFADALLSRILNRVVIDKTGETGLFDLHFEFTPNDATPLGGTALPVAPAGENDISIFTALQEQLGLKLESAKGPVEVLVIDSVQKPSEN